MRCTRPAHYGRRASYGALGWCLTARGHCGSGSDKYILELELGVTTLATRQCRPRWVMACVGKAPEFDSIVEPFGAYATVRRKLISCSKDMTYAVR